MSPDAAGGVIDTRVWGTGQSTSLSGALCMDDTRVAWRLHWSQRLGLISSSLTLRRSSFVTAKPINQDDTNRVADIAHWPDIAEQRGLRQPESRRITVISFKAAAKPDRRAESRENSPCQMTLASMFRVLYRQNFTGHVLN
jgi:hypothetical protein